MDSYEYFQMTVIVAEPSHVIVGESEHGGSLVNLDCALLHGGRWSNCRSAIASRNGISQDSGRNPHPLLDNFVKCCFDSK